MVGVLPIEEAAKGHEYKKYKKEDIIMTAITIFETAAGYAAVAAIGGFGLVYFGSLSAEIFKRALKHENHKKVNYLMNRKAVQ